jgi:hypothetical protein
MNAASGHHEKAARLFTRQGRERLFHRYINGLGGSSPIFFPKVLEDGPTSAREVVGSIVGSQHGSVGWLGHLSVVGEADAIRDASARGLLRACMTDLSGAGCSTIVCCTDNSPHLRAMLSADEFGFQDQTLYWIYEGPADFAVPDAAEGTEVRPLRAGDVTDIVTLDREATGEDRSEFISRMWSSGGWGIFDSSGVRAFYIPFEFGGVKYGAPSAGALIAQNPDDALRIMAHVPKLEHDDDHGHTITRYVNAILPTENGAGRARLEGQDFIPVGLVPRMINVDPTKFAWHPEWIYGLFSLAQG